MMKARRACSLALILLVIVVFFSGCNDGNKQENQWEAPEDIVFKSKTDGLFSLTIGEGAEVYAATLQDGFARYTFDGDLLETYDGTEGILGLYYADGLVYGYRYFVNSVCDIVAFDPVSQDIRKICELTIYKVKTLSVSGDQILLIVASSIERPQDLVTEEDGYIDYKERFLSINTQSGEVTEIAEIDRPMAHYQSSDGNVYVYAKPENQYILYSFDNVEKKAEQIAVMGTGNIFEFALERGYFIGTGTGQNGVIVRKMSDGQTYNLGDTFVSTFGVCFTPYRGNLVYLDQREIPSDDDTTSHTDEDDLHEAKIETSIRTLRLSPDYAQLMPIDPPEGENRVQPQGTVVISAVYFDQCFSTDYLETRSGITGVYVNQPSDEDQRDEFQTSIMAGDDTVDIYILSLNDPVSGFLRDQGGYVPLSGSESIQTYFDSCFDWVGEAATAPNGEIWMLPLYYFPNALWYVPDNFEHLGLSPSDVADFDSYMDQVERLNLETDEYTTFAYDTHTVFAYWCYQYEMTYNDYGNGKVAFSNDVFRRFFEKMWAGWRFTGSMDDESSFHPILQHDFIKSGYDWNANYDTDRVVFSLEPVLGMFIADEGGRVQLEDWRALPMPRLTEEVKHNYFPCTYAVVNPHSKNKELAVAYLEAAAEDMLAAVNKPVFVLKDLSSYEGYYDMSVPVYQDLHNLFSEGLPLQKNFPTQNAWPSIKGYQDGTLTSQEAVDEIQRQADIWLNE